MRSAGAVPAMRIRQATAPRRGSMRDNRRGGVPGVSNYNAGHNPGGLLLQNGFARTEHDWPACPPVWLLGARPVEITSLAQSLH